MLKPLFALTGAALLLGACETTQAVMPAPAQPPPAQVTSYMVFYDWDRSDLSPQAVATLQQATGTFKNGGQSRINAVGYTDTSGPRDYNMALSLRRSNGVKSGLVQQGVPSDAVVATGRGEDGLLVPTADGVREPQNRRVEISMGTGQVSMEIFRDPASYCRALMDKYRQYRRAEIREVAAVATYRCEQGNYAEGIPVLEDGLIKADIPLPQPGYRWPGKSYAPS
jgi:OmpA family